MTLSGNNPTAPGDVSRSVRLPFLLLVVLSTVLPLRDLTSRDAIPLARYLSHTAAPHVPGVRVTARGRVTDLAHNPIARATVQAVLVYEGRTWPLGRATADADGRYAIPSLPQGTWWFVASAPDRARALTTVRLHDDPNADIDFSLAPGVTLEGRVQSLRGGAATPFAGAVVRALREGTTEAEDPGIAVRSDLDGHFVFPALAEGSYRLRVAEPGYETLERMGVPAPGHGVALSIRAMATLDGVVHTVHGDGARGATVMLSGSGVWPPRTIPVDDEGRFHIEQIPGGVYELRASRDDDVAEPLAPLLLDPGDLRDVTLSLGSGAALAGAVVDATTQRPIANAHIVLAEDALSTAPRVLTTDGDGRFRASGLLRRAHQLSARAPGYASRTGVRVVPGEPVTVALDRAAVVEGRVVDGHGDAVPNVRIELTAQDQDGQVQWLSGASVAFREALFSAQSRGPRPLVPNGELGVMPGRVPLVPVVPVPAGTIADGVAPGFTTDQDGRYHIEDVPPGMVVVTASHPAYVRGESESRLVQAGERAAFDIVLHAGGTIDGRVLTDRGFPLRGMQVEVRSASDPLSRRVFTLGDGTFRVPSVLGRVALVAWLGARVAARAEVDVADDATVPVVLTVAGSLRRIEGRVVDTRGFPVGGAAVAITSTEREVLGTSTTITHPDGTFDTVMGGTRGVNLDVRHPEYAPRSVRVDDPSQSLRVEMSPGAALTFELAGDGCVTGESRAELRTSCGPVRFGVVERAEARVEHLCAGRATLLVDTPGCLRVERAVTVPATGELRLGRVEVAAGGGATGEVIDGRGEVVVGAVVSSTEAAPDDLAGMARTDRQGAFAIQSLPEGDVTLIAQHATLGRSLPERVRVIRGTVARGVRLRFERDLRTAMVAMPTTTVLVADVTVSGARAVEVRGVAGGSTAERAGLRAGDRVRTVGGVAVTDARDAEQRMRGALGDDVVLEVERDGVQRTVRFRREGR